MEARKLLSLSSRNAQIDIGFHAAQRPPLHSGYHGGSFPVSPSEWCDFDVLSPIVDLRPLPDAAAKLSDG